MKNHTLKLAIFSFVILAALPAVGKVYMDYKFTDGNVWRVGGFEVYDLIQNGQVVGKAKIEYKRITMLNKPAYRLIWSESWKDENGTYQNDVDTKMLADGLRVLMSTRIEKSGAGEWRYDGNYTGDVITVNVFEPGSPEPREHKLNRKGHYYDVDVLPFILRNIPFEDRNIITLSVVDTTSQTFYTPIAKITGNEVVETSKTQYDCWVVSVSLPSGGFKAWYSKTAQRYLVKLQLGDREILLNHHS